MIEMYRLVFADGVCSPWTTNRLENEEAAKWWNECTEHSCEIETRTFNFLVKYQEVEKKFKKTIDKKTGVCYH